MVQTTPLSRIKRNGREHWTESTAAVRLPGPLAAYRRRCPEVRLELRTGNPTQLATAILADEIDAAFVAEPVPQFDGVRAFQEEPVLVAAEGYPTWPKAGSQIGDRV
jgi:DNA-binding transcriptional LysR family regulator